MRSGVTYTRRATSGGWEARGRTGSTEWARTRGVGFVSVWPLVYAVLLLPPDPDARLLLFISVPIGRSEGDGLTFPVNPRFDADGRWRRRKDWPPELR